MVSLSVLDEIIELVEALIENTVLTQKEKFKMMEEIFEPKIKHLWRHKSKNPKFTIRFFYLLDKMQYYHTSLISDFYNMFHKTQRIRNLNVLVQLYRDGMKLRSILSRQRCPCSLDR